MAHAPGKLEKREPGRASPGMSMVGVSCKCWPQPLTQWQNFPLHLPILASCVHIRGCFPAFCFSLLSPLMDQSWADGRRQGLPDCSQNPCLLSDTGTDRTFGASHMQSLKCLATSL